MFMIVFYNIASAYRVLYFSNKKKTQNKRKSGHHEREDEQLIK